MIKEKNPNFKGLWVKYSDYEIVKVNNEFYIKPTKKAEYSSYDVFMRRKSQLTSCTLVEKLITMSLEIVIFNVI